jgi:hypothetical protein
LQPEIIMRLLSVFFLACLSGGVSAAQPAASEKIEPQPVQRVDPNEPVDAPQVTITKESEQTVEEYRANGKLYMIKITPKHGVPYYLVDDRGDGKFARQEGLDSGLRVPRWVLFRF